MPQLIAGVLRPSTERQQELMEIGVESGLAQIEPCDCAGDCPGWLIGRLGNEGRKTLEPHNFRRQVVGRIGAPGGPSRSAARRGPQGLPTIEIAAGPDADPIGDDARPIYAARTSREVSDGR